MTLMETILMGIGLAMDAVAVTMAAVMCYNLRRVERTAMPLLFAVFQGVMPLLGYLVGSLFAGWVHRYAVLLTSAILGYIGTKMILDGWKSRNEETIELPAMTWKLMFLQAVSTSIDAFAVGIGLLAMEVQILPAASIIAITTFACCLIALQIGARFGALLKDKAQMFGGAILLLIAIKGAL